MFRHRRSIRLPNLGLSLAPSPRSLRITGFPFLVLLVTAATGPALAQTAKSEKPSKLPSAVLFSTASTQSGAAGLDSVLHGALEELDVVTVAGRPGMDLNAVQLAIDCVSETQTCLRAVASKTGAEVLIAPSLQSTQSELVLSVLRFDAADGKLRRVVRRQTGSSLLPATLDGVPAMLRELFELPEPPPHATATTSRPSSSPLTAEASPETTAPWIEPPHDPEELQRPMPVGPWILAGAGALVISGGAVFSALGAGNNDDFNELPLNDPSDLRELRDLRDTAKTQFTISNVMFGVGGAAIVAGGIWLAVALSQPARRDDWQTLVVPRVAAGEVGFSLIHRGGMP